MLFRRRATKSQKLIARVVFANLLLVAGIFSYININNNSSAYEPVNADEWNLSLSYKDSEVDGGQTEMTSETINWPDSGSNTRTFYFQINYSAQDLSRSYAPGELSIKLDLPFSTNKNSTYYVSTPVDDLGFTQYIQTIKAQNHTISATPKGSQSTVDNDWEYTCKEKVSYYDQSYCEFTNTKEIEQSSSLEGTIALAFEVYNATNNYGVMFKDNVELLYQFDIKAVLNGTITSNHATLKCYIPIETDWQKGKYSVHLKPQKIESYDGLGSDAQDYIWIHYTYFGSPLYEWNNVIHPTSNPYETPYERGVTQSSNYDYARARNYIPLEDWQWENEFPEDVIVLNATKQQMTPLSDGKTYVVSDAGIQSTSQCKIPDMSSTISQPTCFEVYVGYPVSAYQDKTIQTEVNSKGTYFLQNNEELVATESAEINLSEFAVEYQGNQAFIEKELTSGTINSGKIKSENGAELIYRITTGFKNFSTTDYDLTIGDDLLYYEDLQNGQINELSESDYRFNSITLPNSITGTNGESFNCNTSQIDIFVRLKDESEYRQLDNGSNKKACGVQNYRRITWNFPSDTVGWKAIVRNLSIPLSSYPIETSLTVHSQDLPQSGKLTNFAYVEANKDGALLNEPSLDNYTTDFTKNTIAAHDIESYGHYQQRSLSSETWEPYEMGEVYSAIYVSNVDFDNGTPQYNPNTDGFESTYSSRTALAQTNSNGEYDWNVLKGIFPEEDLFTTFSTYEFVPANMQVVSTPEEIINTITCQDAPNSSSSDSYSYHLMVDKNGERIFNSADECTSYIRSHTTVTITENYENAGRTRVKITYDFTEKPFSVLSKYTYISFTKYTTKYRVPYDNYIENKNANYLIRALGEFMNTKSQDFCTNGSIFAFGGCYNVTPDNAYPDMRDMNGNGVLTDKHPRTQDEIRIMSATSTEQSIIETIKTDRSSTYVTSESYVSLGGMYNYKLSLRTGANKITDTVIYDNLETAYGENPHWQGHFAGVDISFANSQVDANGKPIRVKVFYSPNANAGSLADDTSWQEYSSTVPSDNVKSIAFQYLTSDGTPAVIPNNTALNTVIIMVAINDNDNNGKTYNNFRSEWTAIDPSGTPVPGIVGTTSNITSADLNNLFAIHVENEWIDNDDRYGYRPDAMTYTLKRSGEVDSTRNLSSANNTDGFDFGGLYLFDEPNYTVPTPEAPEHYSVSVEHEEGSRNYKFIYTLSDEFDIAVEHYWVDNNNKHNTRPDNVSYNLKKGSDTEDSLSLQSSDGETDSFTGLSLLDEDDYSVPTPTVEHYSTTVVYDSANRKYTFTHTLSDNFDIHVVHEWVDNNNAYGRRPASYSYELLKDSATDKTQSSNSEWKADFTNLPLLDEDSYSVKTPVISYYDTVLKSYDADTHTYVFESTLNEKFDINVVHIWVDDNDANGFRPGSIDYELTKDGQQDKTQTSSANWTASFPSLPLLDESKYGVTTPTVDHYATSVDYNPDTHTYTFISTLSDLVDITVEQVWHDQDNHFGLRPGSLNYTLKKGNDNADTLSLSNDSSDKFEGIKLLEIGQYDVPQFNVDNYTVTREYNASTRSYTFIYELITEPINVKHTWIDNSNALGARPEQINFTLKRGNETEKSNSIATTDNTAQFLFANVPSSLINDFNVTMDEVPFYTTRNLGYDASTHTFSFESTINPLSIKVVNIWVDDHNAHGLRPDSLKFNANDGTSDVDTHTITTANDTENFTFDSLFEYKKDDYAVNLEQNPANYRTEVAFDPETLTYTFTHTLTATFDVNVIHIWDDEDNKYGTRPDSIEHPLKRNDETADSKDFNSENSWTNSYTGLPLLNESEFSVPDSETAGYTTTKDYNADTHTYTFTSKLIMTPIKVVHIWDDEDDTLGIRPDEVNFSLNNNGNAEEDSALDTSDKTINTDGFDIAEVPAILIDNYDVTMAPVDYYDTTVEYDSETHTYTFTSRVTPLTITVNNIWEDDNNRAKKRPESLNFILTKDGEVINTRELTTENNEDSFSFEDLIKYFKDGYNVTLENEPEGYTTTVDFDPETMTFTFKHALKPTPADNSNTGDQITKYLAIFALALAIGLFAAKGIKSKKQDDQE